MEKLFENLQKGNNPIKGKYSNSLFAIISSDGTCVTQKDIGDIDFFSYKGFTFSRTELHRLIAAKKEANAPIYAIIDSYGHCITSKQIEEIDFLSIRGKLISLRK